jgi:hypothetical protein
MADFSWPVFYRLAIKGENELPRKIIPGRRLRINLTLVNELDMFRGDDIMAECPIPIRVAAIPIEDNSIVDQKGRVLNHHEVHCEIQTKNVRVKPVIERNGHGTVVIDLSPSPILRHDEELMFILQIGISPSSRIFNHVIPVSTSPFVMVSPHSAYAKEHLRRGHESDSDGDDGDGDDEQMSADIFLKLEKHNDDHVHGPNCSHNHEGEHDEHDDEDFDDIGEGEFDFDEDIFDQFGEEDDEFNDDEHNMVSEEVLAMFVDDEDIYETPSTFFEFQDPKEEQDTTLGELKGIYHALVCDPLLHSPLHPNLQAMVDVIKNNTKTDQKTTSSSDPTSPQSSSTIKPTTTTNPRGIQVVGAGVRRPRALPPQLQKSSPQAAPETSQVTVPEDTKDRYQYPILGMSKTPGEMGQMLQNVFKNPRFRILDPLNGLFATYTAQTAATLQFRQTLAMASYAYVKVVQGLSIGGRIWDGSIYLIKFLQRLFMTSHTPLDGPRCLELGSGTGVLGIWWWQLVQQRTLTQLKQLCNSFGVEKHQVEAIMHVICNGDFGPAGKVFLGLDDNNSSNNSIISVTIPTKVYQVAHCMKSFITNQPAMILTDQPKIMSLLEQNARFNTTAKFPLYNQRIIPGSIQIVDSTDQNDPKTTITMTNKEHKYTQLPLPIAPVTGLHALTCDWNQPLNKHILKTCGVYIPSSTNILFTSPPQVSTKITNMMNSIELPDGVGDGDVQWTEGFDQIGNFGSDYYTKLRTEVSEIYNHYESLESAINSPNKQAITGLEEMLLVPQVPTQNADLVQKVPKYVTLPGLDVIFAIECLYNDRYFKALQTTIIDLFKAHMFAHAQRLYLHNATKSDPTLTPKLQLPIIVLSYRFRATHEEELIKNTFFRVLRQFGLYHTECPLYRVLGESSIHTDTIGAVKTLSETVHQRNKDRKEREDAIRNALGDLDLERQHNTRLAVIYYSPGTIKGKDIHGEPAILSPLPYLTPNAQFWFKLFQKL